MTGYMCVCAIVAVTRDARCKYFQTNNLHIKFFIQKELAAKIRGPAEAYGRHIRESESQNHCAPRAVNSLQSVREIFGLEMRNLLENRSARGLTSSFFGEGPEAPEPFFPSQPPRVPARPGGRQPWVSRRSLRRLIKMRLPWQPQIKDGNPWPAELPG